MAKLQDHSNFSIKATPVSTNWWTFRFEFFYKEKPVFNPEIMKDGVFEADELPEFPLLPILEKAMESQVDGETFVWGAWEEELEIEIKYVHKNPQADGGFDFTVFVAEQCFKDGEMNFLFQNAGVRIFVNREDLKKFYQDLKAEMFVNNMKPSQERLERLKLLKAKALKKLQELREKKKK